MAQVRNKQIVLKDYVNGFPQESDMLLKSSATINLNLREGSNAVLVKNLYLSCDPYIRGRMTKTEGSYIEPFTPGSVCINLFIQLFVIICYVLVVSYFLNPHPLWYRHYMF